MNKKTISIEEKGTHCQRHITVSTVESVGEIWLGDGFFILGQNQNHQPVPNQMKHPQTSYSLI